MTAMPRPAGFPCTAMVLAAGLGTRLRPVTDTVPKALVEVGGRTLLDHAIDRLAAAGIERVVVNVHYRADTVKKALAARERPAIAFSEEPELLDTGGGVKQALPLLGEEFFVVNSDVLWRDGDEGALSRLVRGAAAHDADAVLLLQPTATAIGYDGSGDFLLHGSGVPTRRGALATAPYLFAGIQFLRRRAFDGVADRVFSLNRIYDRAAQRGRLRAVVHDGAWYHIGTPAGLAEARARLAAVTAGD